MYQNHPEREVEKLSCAFIYMVKNTALVFIESHCSLLLGKRAKVYGSWQVNGYAILGYNKS